MGQQQSQSKDEILYQQVTYNDVKAIKSLWHEGAGLEWVDKLGRTPLILACTNEDLYDVAKTLLELGSNVNAYSPGCNGGTPLHHAAKSGLVNTVKLLLSHGANPLVLNDNIQTALEVARVEGHSNVVRAIESHTCLFSGWMREFYGPSFLELFAPQLLSRRVWVVVVPTGSRNPARPLKLELVVYDSLQDAQPRIKIDLWKANLEELKSYQSDASVMIGPMRKRPEASRSSSVSQARRWVQVDRQTRLKLAAETKGDMKQLNWFCEACIGIPQDPINNISHESIISQELMPSVSLNPVDVSISSANCEKKEDGGYGVCVICVDASSEAVCVPCGHVAGCISCMEKIKNKKFGCPVCRANIDQVIKLYHV